uniref:Methionine--tRNA ligase, mitochondrial n=1 Tax=Syphacia muris TaxID=451379 RepID=A0A0N5ANR1_9BILA
MLMVFDEKDGDLWSRLSTTTEKPHIGHLYTALLGDCAFRWNKMKDRSNVDNIEASKSVFISGTDEHGLKIQKAAKSSGMSTIQFCDMISSKFQEMFIFFNIKPTVFIRTTQENHLKTVSSVWSILKAKDLILKKKYAGWYSVTDECFYTKKEVTLSSGQMISRMTGSPVQWVEEENYLFNFERFIPTIRKWLTENNVIYPTHYLPEALQVLDKMSVLSVSRDRRRLEWGIPVPDDSFQTVNFFFYNIYVWLDALCSYLTASGYPSFKSGCWPPDCQIIGKDILKFHAVYWPSLLLALDLPLPKNLFVHSHWLSNGIKMSKSIGNVVDPLASADLLTVDGLRYFLLKQGLPQNDADFTEHKAIEVINADLVNTLGNLLSRSTVKKLNNNQIYTNFSPDVFDEKEQQLNADFIEKLTTLRDRCSADYDKLMIYNVLTNILEVAYKANSLFAIYEPWKIKREEKVSSIIFNIK